MNADERKRAAVDFLTMVTAGDIEEAFAKHVDMTGKQHNPFTPAGMPALMKGMRDNHAVFPNKRYEVQNVLGDGDLAAVHARLELGSGGPTLTVVHVCRFRGDKIVEFWDCVTPVPDDCPNTDGLF